MKEKTKKKFNKKLLLFILPVLAVALVTAAILTYYGVWSGMFTVTQSVTVENGVVINSLTDSLVAGGNVVDCDGDGNGYWVKNNADVTTDVKFGTRCNNSVGSDDGERNEVTIDWTAIGGGTACNGITTEIYGILKLVKKDTGTWQPLDPEQAITIEYTIVGDTFAYDVVDGGPIPEGYELVYAMDKANRFSTYATVKTVAEINSGAEGLPMAGDWNADCVGGTDTGEYYCNGLNDFKEHYEHCVGAKLWIVKSSDIESGGVLSWANMAKYYYETDLIVYSKTTDGKITLPANGGGFNFCVENDFTSNLEGSEYTLITKVLPA